MSGVFRNIDPPTPHRPASVSSPRLWCGGRTHSLGGEGVGGSIVRKTTDTALYSIYVVLCGTDPLIEEPPWGQERRVSTVPVQQFSLMNAFAKKMEIWCFFWKKQLSSYSSTLH
jgi:hypothetical protein